MAVAVTWMKLRKLVKSTCYKAPSLSWCLVAIYLTAADHRWSFYPASGNPERGEGSKPVEQFGEGH